MTRGSKRLSAAQVRTAKRPGFYSDGDGLYLQVGPTGTKSWVFRYTVAGQRRGHGLGRVNLTEGAAEVRPDELQGRLGLAEARIEAERLRALVRRGVDPIEHRAETAQAREAAKLAARAVEDRRKSFKHCAEVVIAQKEEELTNAKSRKQWRSTLEQYVFPALGERKIDELTKADIAEVLKPIWQTKRETADRLRDRIKAVFNYAKHAEAFKGDNPAEKAAIDLILGKQKNDARSNQPALPHARIGAFVTELRKREGMGARALELGIMTAARSGEVRGATWGEFDLKAKLWTIPAGRMKAKREHVVTLSDSAVKLLQALPRIARVPHVGKQAEAVPDYVFPAARGGQLSDMALTAVVRRMHDDSRAKGGAGWTDPKQLDDEGNARVAVVHGFRSTFRDWTAEQGYERDMAELALAHNVGTAVERAYRRSDMVDRRRAMMDEWASYCAKPATSNVAKLPQGVAA